MEIVTVTDDELGVILSKEEALMILSFSGLIVWGTEGSGERPPEGTMFHPLYEELRSEGTIETPAYNLYEWISRKTDSYPSHPLDGIIFKRIKPE